jgi:protease-4
VASDLIWREVQITDQKKPVIASFSTTAASGGYYLAMGARKVVAMPGTLTGSIGIVAGKFNAQSLLARLHIGVDVLDMGRRAGYGTLSRGYSEEEAQAMETQLQEFYQLFLRRVAEGRQQRLEQIETVARGRVWTGSQALAHGLIDELGGLHRALALARQAAGLPPNRRLRVVPMAKKAGFLSYLSLSFLHTLEPIRIWALMPGEWRIR